MASIEKLMSVCAENVRQLLALAGSVVCEPREAEDVLQDVIVKLLSEPERCKKVDNPLAFLRACVRNEAIDHVRKLGRQTPTADEILASMRGHTGDEEYRRVEDLMWVRSFLSEQPEDMRQAFIAYAVDGFTIAQIAREMGLPQDTLRKRFDAIKKRIGRSGASGRFT